MSSDDETVIEAFERMVHELLDNPDVSVMHPTGSGHTEITVAHYGGPEVLQDLADRHAHARMSSWGADVDAFSPGDDAEIEMAEADFILTKDAHDPYNPKPSSSGVSGSDGSGAAGSGSSAGATSAAESDDTDDSSDGPLPEEEQTRDPSMDYGYVDGTRSSERHLIAADGGSPFACGTKYGGTPVNAISDNYESVRAFLSDDDDACKTCRILLARKLNLPPKKLPADLRGVV